MIISHRLKFAFFRVPKTGSSTAETMLRLSNAFTDEDIKGTISGMLGNIDPATKEQIVEDLKANIPKTRSSRNPEYFSAMVKATTESYISHLTPSDAVKYNLITMDQLREYTAIAFLRNPRERHLSAYAHRVGVSAIPPVYKKSIKEGTFQEDILTRPTCGYFYVDGERVLEPLFFNDYQNEIRRAISVVGGYYFAEIPRLNVSRGRNQGYPIEDFYDDEVNKILDNLLADDEALYNELMQER